MIQYTLYFLCVLWANTHLSNTLDMTSHDSDIEFLALMTLAASRFEPKD